MRHSRLGAYPSLPEITLSMGVRRGAMSLRCEGATVV
jgi:hypothetical protein